MAVLICIARGLPKIDRVHHSDS